MASQSSEQGNTKRLELGIQTDSFLKILILSGIKLAEFFDWSIILES